MGTLDNLFKSGGGIDNLTNSQTFTTSGTFTVPDGVSKVFISGCGGGGGGKGGMAHGSSTTRYSVCPTPSGYPSPCYIRSPYWVEAGDVIDVVIGVGGVGGIGNTATANNQYNLGTDGTAGTPSYFGALRIGGGGIRSLFSSSGITTQYTSYNVNYSEPEESYVENGHTLYFNSGYESTSRRALFSATDVPLHMGNLKHPTLIIPADDRISSIRADTISGHSVAAGEPSIPSWFSESSGFQAAAPLVNSSPANSADASATQYGMGGAGGTGVFRSSGTHTGGNGGAGGNGIIIVEWAE